MKYALLLAAAATLSLSACEKTVNNPAPKVEAPSTVAVPVPVPVPGPAGEPGKPGPAGPEGAPGKPGDTTVIVAPDAKPAPENK